MRSARCGTGVRSSSRYRSAYTERTDLEPRWPDTVAGAFLCALASYVATVGCTGAIMGMIRRKVPQHVRR
jgi:hypothetical protein